MLEHALEYRAGQGERQVTLADFVAAGPCGCRLELMREGCTASALESVRLMPVNKECTLREALNGQLVIEFPRFRVTLATGPQAGGQSSYGVERRQDG